MSKRFNATTVVVQFGAMEARHVLEAIGALSTPYSLVIEKPSSPSEYDYAPSDLTLESAHSELESGGSNSLLITAKENHAGFFAMIFCPFMDGASRSWWLGSFELETGYSRDLIRTVRRIPKILFVSVSLEDDLDLSVHERITEESFPWSDWRLVEAVVADGRDIRTQPIKRGPAATKVQIQ